MTHTSTYSGYSYAHKWRTVVTCSCGWSAIRFHRSDAIEAFVVHKDGKADALRAGVAAGDPLVLSETR